MAVTINTNGFDINFGASIDKRLIVDRVDGTTSSLVSLEPNYNYTNMYVWVREEKSFYYLIDSPEEGGATVSDWTQASGGASTTPDSLINAKKVAWESASGMPGQLASWGLTAGQDPNTVFFYNSSGLNSPQGDIVVSLNPATATPGLNRDFKLILANAARVENGNTWSVAYDGTRLVEYGEGRVEPHVLDFIWSTSSVAPDGEYLLTKYVVDVPVDDFTTTGAAFGRDFTIKRQDLVFSSGGVTVFNGTGVGSSGVFPKGSILFVDESFVTCEGITGSVTGVNVSFGLSTVTIAGTMGATISNFEPQLSEFGISNSYEMLFPPKALGDFFTGSIFYSKSPIGIVRLTQPAMLVMRPVGGNIAIGTRLKYRIPYIVDEASVNSISGTNFIAAPANSSTGCAKSGFVSGTSFIGPLVASASVVFDTPYSSASYSVVVTAHAFNDEDYIYSVINKLSTGFTIRIDSPSTPTPIGATAMWITNCYDGSGLSSGGGAAGAQGPTGPGGGSAIDLTEIAFGTGTGITSSNIFTFDNSDLNLLASTASSFTNSKNSTILSSETSNIRGACSSSIISSLGSTISSTFSNLITISSIVSSYSSRIEHKTSGHFSLGNIINGGLCNIIIGGGFGSSIIGGLCNEIYCPGSNLNGFNTSIIGGVLNKICDGSGGSSIIGGSENLITLRSLGSSIMGGGSNTIYATSSRSSIIGGCCNFVCFCSSNSIVISSECSGLTNSASTSAIISSFRSYNSNGDYSTIISGKCNKISSPGSPSNSGGSLAMFGYCNSIIGNSLQSGILGGSKNTMTASCNSMILGGCNLQMNSINNMIYVPSIRGFGSVQFNLATSSTNVTLDADNFTLLAYPPINGMTVSLPTAISSPHRLYVIKKDGSSTQSIVYIDPNVSDTIEGYAGSIELINPWEYNMLQSDGVNMWIKLGGAVGINL